MLYATYFYVSGLKLHHAIGLYDEINKARKACVRKIKAFESLSIPADLKWEEFCDGYSNFTWAFADSGNMRFVIEAVANKGF